MQLGFEYIFEDTSYRRMTELSLGPRSDGYVRQRKWRSTDLGQRLTVGILEDPVKELTVLTIRAPDGDRVTPIEIVATLDWFYPHRKAIRQDHSDQPELVKFAIWPGEEDLKLPWYSQQLIGNPDLPEERS